MKHFGINDEEIQKTGDDGRLQRPIAVAVFGCLISTGIIAIVALKADVARNGSTAAFLVAFLAFACLASCTYAFLGWRFSRNLAHRVIGTLGGIIALGGLGYLIWLLLARGA